MLPSILLALREGVEIALILSIVFGALRKFERSDLNRFVWGGTAFAVVVSVAVALLLSFLGANLEGMSEQVFEGITMLTAAGILTWMIFWMQTQSRAIKNNLEHGVRKSVQESSHWALFLLAFLAVSREGIELAIFTTASSMATELVPALIGTVIGLAAAAVLGYGLYSATIQLDLRLFFQATGALLVLFAAGLVGHGTHELVEAGILPAIIANVWDLRPVLDDNSNVGLFLKTLFGYNANPTLAEAIAYLAYLAAMMLFLRRREPGSVVSQKA